MDFGDKSTSCGSLETVGKEHLYLRITYWLSKEISTIFHVPVTAGQTDIHILFLMIVFFLLLRPAQQKQEKVDVEVRLKNQVLSVQSSRFSCSDFFLHGFLCPSLPSLVRFKEFSPSHCCFSV